MQKGSWLSDKKGSIVQRLDLQLGLNLFLSYASVPTK